MRMMMMMMTPHHSTLVQQYTRPSSMIINLLLRAVYRQVHVYRKMPELFDGRDGTPLLTPH